MMNQVEMTIYFQKKLTSHTVELKGNKIECKRKFNSSSFSNFVITFLNGCNGEVSINSGGRTMRYKDQSDLFCLMGAFSYLEA